MIAADLISDEVIPLRTSDTGIKALAMMEENRISHLPIVNNVEFLGLISENDIYNLNEPEEPLGNHNLSLHKPYVVDTQHVYDVIRQISMQKLTLVPVLDSDMSYLGVITIQRLVQAFAKFCAVDNPGGIIILEMNQHDYSLSQIAGIIESNDAKVLSLYIHADHESTKMEVTIKVNKADISGIIQTFNRYEYVIKATYNEDEFRESLRDRFDLFMNYLNV
ncbi:MAG: CBS domain-containing protein [Bacteroidetes bacterium]|nr:CBS domain-containing protein [Bacteroidota bacterium]MBU1718637.1 CBS domain-containing protein [Bacteroidota bacterium]